MPADNSDSKAEVPRLRLLWCGEIEPSAAARPDMGIAAPVHC
ncbi:MAG: hypothetical protein ACREE2_19480 [Stellaceae bacterium]